MNKLILTFAIGGILLYSCGNTKNEKQIINQKLPNIMIIITMMKAKLLNSTTEKNGKLMTI